MWKKYINIIIFSWPPLSSLSLSMPPYKLHQNTSALLSNNTPRCFFHSDPFVFVFCFLFYLWPHSLCDLVVWKMGVFHAAWVREVENSTALAHDLATARCLITAINRVRKIESERKRGEFVCVYVCVSVYSWGIVGQTKQNRQSRRALKHTPLHSCAHLKNMWDEYQRERWLLLERR